jgi:hypothetical protein
VKGLNLVELLKNEIDNKDWDMGRIKVLFRALKIAKPKDSIGFIESRFGQLVVFTKEMCLLMEALENDSPGCFDDLLEEIIDAILTPPASSVQLISTWLLEIFVRGIIDISIVRLTKLEVLSSVIDKRQLLLIRGRRGDKNYFRKQKTAIHSFPNNELPYLVWGASCLPKDEYEKWVDTVKGSLTKPLGGLFLQWAVHKKPELVSKLESAVADHPE